MERFGPDSDAHGEDVNMLKAFINEAVQTRKVQGLLRVAKFAASQFAVSLSRSSLDLLYMCVRPLMLRPTGLHPDLLR